MYVYPDGVRSAPLNLEKRGCEPGARFASKALPKCIWMNGICERTSGAMWPAWHCKSAGVFDHSSRLSSARQQASRYGTDENSTQISRISSNPENVETRQRLAWTRHLVKVRTSLVVVRPSDAKRCSVSRMRGPYIFESRARPAPPSG